MKFSLREIKEVSFRMYSSIEDPQIQEKKYTKEGILNVSFDKPINIKTMNFPVFELQHEHHTLDSDNSKHYINKNSSHNYEEVLAHSRNSTTQKKMHLSLDHMVKLQGNDKFMITEGMLYKMIESSVYLLLKDDIGSITEMLK